MKHTKEPWRSTVEHFERDGITTAKGWIGGLNWGDFAEVVIQMEDDDELSS